MKRRVFLVSLLSVWLAFAAPAQQQQQPKNSKVDVAAELQSLVRAERDFSAAAAAHGTREAFLANLADEAVVFSPGPVNARKTWEARPASSSLLSWEPVYADIARSGDLGYTTGPWEFRPKGAADRPVAQGYYMTIWKKQAAGVWKFVLDLGTQNPPPQGTPPTLAFSPDFRKNTAKEKLSADVAAERKALLKLEREFTQASLAKSSAAPAFESYAADDLRLMREGKFPVLGKRAAVSTLAAAPGALICQPVFADASRAGDLGYTYGTYSFGGNGSDVAPIEQGNYVRIWKKREGRWRIVLDLLNPVAPAKS